MLRYADLLIMLLALPVVLIAGLPVAGWVAGAIGWTGQRAIQVALEARADAADDPHSFFRFMAGSLIGRSWFLVAAIFVAGILDREYGLVAAVLAAILFTSYLAISLITRPTKTDREPS